MRWKLAPKREQRVMDLIDDLAGELEDDVLSMCENTGSSRAQCMASILRPFINLQMPNAGPAATEDRRQRPWRVQCRFGFYSGRPDLDDNGTFDWETVRGLDGVAELVRLCFNDYHGGKHSIEWSEVDEFHDRPMKQRFGGLYSNISKGNGSANTRIIYETPLGVDMFLDVTVERDEKQLDPEQISEDSLNPGTSRLRAMREARGQS